jgi:ribose transport system substrate-binding protein
MERVCPTQSRQLDRSAFTRFVLPALALAGMLAAATQVCAQTIAVFTKNTVNPNYEALRLGADRAASAMGARTYHLVPTKPDDPVEQIELLATIPQRKPDAIIFNPADEKRVEESYRKNVEALGIPTINIVNRADYADKISFVGADDEAIGYATAQYLLKALGGKGNVMILEGPPTAVTAVDRLHGFNRAIKEYAGITVVASVNGKYLRPAALAEMKAVIKKNMQIDGIIATNDSMALGALDAIDAAGQGGKIKIVAINGIPEAIDAIEKGKLLATEDYSGFKLGCISTMVAIRHLRGLPVPRKINLPVMMIDKTNYADLKIPVKERQCPEWARLVD